MIDGMKELQAVLGVPEEITFGLGWNEANHLLHVVGTWAKVCEALRKQKKEEVIALLPLLFRRLLVFANMVGVDLEEAVWHKYPGLCPSCLASADCDCIRQKKTFNGKETMDGFRANLELRPKTLDGWQDMFGRIYGKVNKLVWKEMVWYHFEEEVGEVSDAYNFQLGPERLRDELADAFAWLLSFCNRMEINMARLIAAKYFRLSSYDLAAL